LTGGVRCAIYISELHVTFQWTLATMIAFKQALTLTQFMIPLICCGVLLMGFFLFTYIQIRFRERMHLTMMLLAFIGFMFVFSESMVLLIGGWMLRPDAGMQFHRLEQVWASLFIFIIPFLLSNLLELRPGWQKANRFLAMAGLAVAAGFILISFIQPDLFVSMTKHRDDWLLRQADHGRGFQGPLYPIRDAVLFLFIIYSVICFIVEMVMHRRFRYLVPTFIGLLLAIHGALVDMLSTYNTGENAMFYDIFPGSRHSRFVLGITLFILFSMGATLRRFLDLARETEIANKRAGRESEKNLSQNRYIRDVLKSIAGDLVGRTASLSSSIADYTDNSQDQAAATEEISASIEEISAAVESVKKSAEEQNSSIETLTGTMENLSRSTGVLNETVAEASGMIRQISQNAKSGDESLSVMNDSMSTIHGSSAEITGIIGIINDISDRINLLSLNAAIEAARAGDAGRGFAVVADEISKLADQTASSIKNIDSLIKTNETEIANGMKNITVAVERINAIMHDIESIVVMVTAISEQAARQTEANRIVSGKAGEVKSRSEHITIAMGEQSNATGEIMKTIGSINDMSMTNTGKIQAITDASQALVEMVTVLNNDIEVVLKKSDEA
jgi:methyl-accepting chemotaxis protein